MSATVRNPIIGEGKFHGGLVQGVGQSM